MTVDFNDYFWGEKNSGYEVLYHNMKSGLTASKELSEYLRERSTLEEHNSKILTKLAHKVGSGGANGTFSPVWVILKSSAERLSELHLQMVHKISELVKNITKYAEELHKKHKSVKEEESNTQEAVHAMKDSTLAVQKAKDLYTTKLAELEKCRKDNASAKDIEKGEAKLRKHQEDYKNLAEKHNVVKGEFERKMTATCKKFQDVEELHLLQMKEFLTTYIDIVQSNHDLVGDVYSEFRRQFLEMTVDKLLEQFVLNKYTGLEKPEIVELDLLNLTPITTTPSSNQTIINTPTMINHSTNSTNSPTNVSCESPALSITSVQSQPAAIVKKESNLRSWFTSGSSAAVTSTGSASSTPSAVANKNSVTINQPQQPMNSQQYDDLNEQISSPGSLSAVSSTVQRSRDNRASRECIEAISAPTSPSDNPEQNHTNSNIGRNHLLRGSKFSGFLRSRREKAKSKKTKKKKDNGDNSSNKDLSVDSDIKQELSKSESSTHNPLSALATGGSGTGSNFLSQSGTASPSFNLAAPTAQPDIDEDGYSVQPTKEATWDETTTVEKNRFYSSSDSDSEDEHERKIHVEIKPLNNGTAPISCSVDELRATVENLSLSPLGGALSQQQHHHHHNSSSLSHNNNNNNQNNQNNTNNSHTATSPLASNASTPTQTHPYAPLQSPTLSASNNSNNRYADLGDIFSEVGDISASAPPSATLSRLTSRQIPTPTSGGSSIAIPRPPSRRSEMAARGRVSPASISRADSVGSLEFRTAGVAIGSSRGPSPLTIGISDTIPLAVAFHEIIHAYFKGADETKCQVKIAGDMMLSFPAGIVNVLANNPNPAKLSFRIKNLQNLENLLPNKSLINVDTVQSTTASQLIEFNMNALTALLRRQSEQNPTASYFNVDILKYQVRQKPGATSCPFQLVSYWKCETTQTDLKVDYKYNSHAMAVASPLLNVTISVPVDGGVKNVQSKPHSAWLGESNRLVWNFTDISQHSDNHGIDSLRARLEISNGPTMPSLLSTQFNCEGTTLSGIEFELAGSGYRLSLVKRRFVSGKYICEGDGIRSVKSPTPPTTISPNTFNKTG